MWANFHNAFAKAQGYLFSAVSWSGGVVALMVRSVRTWPHPAFRKAVALLEEWLLCQRVNILI